MAYIPAWSAQDFLGQFLKMIPTGRAWRRDGFAVSVQGYLALMQTIERVWNTSLALLIDIFPATSVFLLPDWESSLGLPDPCAGEAPTIAARQAQVVARLANSGGQSVPYFIAFAEALGFTITITEGSAASRTWTINTAAIAPPTVFRAGLSRAGDLLESIPTNNVLVCEMNRIKPADTILIFNYT
jgi:uncharacterized protein YmfQ (DUF2313 family)